MKWFLPVLIAVLAFSGAAGAQGVDALTQSIVGDWTRDGQIKVTLNEDGTMSDNKGANGTWKWANRDERKIDVNEGKERISYYVSFADDGKTGTGKVHRNGQDERRVGMGVKFVRAAAAAAPQVVSIPTLNGPPLTKPAAGPPPAEPAQTPPPAAPAQALPPAAPPTAEPKAQSVTGKWLAEQDTQWQAAFERDVRQEFDRGVAELKKLYMAGLDAQLAQSAREGKLDDAIKVRAERDRVAAGGDVLDAGDAGGMVALTGLRTSYARKWNALAEERSTKARGLFNRYDAVLSQNQTMLTQRQRIDEALEIRAKREQISAEWLKPPLGKTPGMPAAAAPSSPAPTAVEAPRAGAPPKPPTGVPPEATYFNGNWFHVFLEKKLTWRDAARKCTNAGGHLAIVPDEATQEVIVQLQNGRQLWLGATDEKSEGHWKWVDGTAMKYSAWEENQPSNNKTENYLETWKPKGEWMDGALDDPNVVGYICEWKAK